MLTKQHLN